MVPMSTRLGPTAVAILGLAFIGVGSTIKTGYIEVRRGPRANSGGVTVRTGAGDVQMPLSQNDSATTSPAPPTPRELAADTLFAAAASNDSNAVPPTAAE